MNSIIFAKMLEKLKKVLIQPKHIVGRQIECYRIVGTIRGIRKNAWVSIISSRKSTKKTFRGEL